MQINNHKYRRMLDRLPVEMKGLMKHVNHECIVIEHHAGSMAWSVDFQIDNKNLSLIYDRGSLDVTKESDKDNKNLFPRDKDMFNVTVKDLANEINKEFA